MRWTHGVLALVVAVSFLSCSNLPRDSVVSSDGGVPPVQFLERGEGVKPQGAFDFVALMRFFNRARTLHSVGTAYPHNVPLIQQVYAPRPGVEDRYHLEGVVGYLNVNAQPNSFALYACTVRNGNNNYFVSVDANCEGQLVGPRLGFAFVPWLAPPDGNVVMLYRCRLNTTAILDHFVSQDRNCEGQIFEGWLGYARAVPY
jgi:hypothetical protein